MDQAREAEILNSIPFHYLQMSRHQVSVSAFYQFCEGFRWNPSWAKFHTGCKCLENVLLALYFKDLISNEQFEMLHEPSVVAKIWKLLADVDRIKDRTPDLCDIALRDHTAHAMLFVEPRNAICESTGYHYTEWHSDDERIRIKTRRHRYDDEFVSLELLSTKISGVQISFTHVGLARSHFCKVVSYYDCAGEVEGGYISVDIGDVVLQWSYIWPSRPQNICPTGYVYCCNLALGGDHGWVAAECLALSA